VPLKSTSTSSFTVVEADPIPPPITTRIAEVFEDPQVVSYLLALFGCFGSPMRLPAVAGLVVSMIAKVSKDRRMLGAKEDELDGGRCTPGRLVVSDVYRHVPTMVTLVAVLGMPDYYLRWIAAMWMIVMVILSQVTSES
jgi:hypothetical protein